MVEGELITAVSLTGRDAPIARDGAEIIDCGGDTLMPGLVEAHAHLSWPSSVERFEPRFILPPEEMTLTTARNARILLDHGFTSAYSAGALGERIEVVLRDDINAGWLPGPRLKASTIERSPPEEGQDPAAYVSHGRGPEAMRAFIDHCAKLKIDSVKLQISGEDALKPGASQQILYDEDEVQAAGEQAKKHGLWLNAHTQASAAIKMAVRHNVRALYHCTFADEEALDMLEAKRDEIFIAPAIGVIVATLEATPPPHIDMSHMKEAAKPVLELAQKLIPELRRRGIRVLPGGDYGFPFNPNGANARDLQHFVNLFGYTPAEALAAATGLGGAIMGMEDRLGLVKPAYLADLLLVKGDVSRDVSAMPDKNNLLMIMKGGVFHKAPAGVRAIEVA
jgi:imidazolonepropionase-like amidohydrolase